ncbi:hypothetical protein K435DRAFT_880339 [Dendrothele bispora CBS 962.96]|uniref:Uncharacterized protein n=1 Tax=Dendrothele bispora (strain CBS 962.96) TaxID=1314807 RepID=A0A4S8KJZ1_DENBC|nr:hypothetical protein K435DRAFT_880339 [Dendrothele bispora CBS 962.96]
MRPQTTNLGSAEVHCKKSSVLDTLRANFGTYTSDITNASQRLIDAEQDAQRCDDEIQKLEADIRRFEKSLQKSLATSFA